MSTKKIIAVVGSTGAQGGALVRAILSDKASEFSVRAITRKASSDAAKALAALGAEVVEADIDNVESLTAALKGAYGAFFVTFFWNHFNAAQETQQGKNCAEAAKAAGIKHAVWSTLEDTRKYVKEGQMPKIQKIYFVPHFDAKADADHFFADLGVPTTNVLTSMYWENFIHFGMGPKRGADGVLAITMPLGTAKLVGISSVDIGKCVYGVFKDPKNTIGKTIGLAGDANTVAEIAEKIGKLVGEKVVYNAVDADVYRGFGFPGADEMGNMLQYYRDSEKEFGALRSVELSRKLNPELVSFDQWLAENGKKIPIA